MEKKKIEPLSEENIKWMNPDCYTIRRYLVDIVKTLNETIEVVNKLIEK